MRGVSLDEKPESPPRRTAGPVPDHVPSRCFLYAMRGIARMPWCIQRPLGGAAGRLLHRLLWRRRRIAETNLTLCFPQLDEAARSGIVRRHFRSLGLGCVETMLAWWGSDGRITARARIIGSGHLEAALSRGRGVLLVGGHFTTFEIGGRILASRFAVNATYRPHDDPRWDAVLRAGRTRYLEGLVPHRDPRAMLRCLRRNGILWYAPDQDYSGRRSVFTRFFAERAATTAATSWLARTSGARVVPYASHRRADDSGWDVVIGPALEDFPSGDDLADAQRLNAVLEADVERSIEQYLWVHRRFKTRPPGVRPAYDAALLRRRRSG